VIFLLTLFFGDSIHSLTASFILQIRCQHRKRENRKNGNQESSKEASEEGSKESSKEEVSKATGQHSRGTPKASPDVFMRTSVKHADRPNPTMLTLVGYFCLSPEN
jgi:hypothetical protein